jgi:hypothetical protein
LVVDYDSSNSLPIGNTCIGLVLPTEPEPYLTLLDLANINLNEKQKLLLHLHYRFGHLNLASLQQILRVVPFLSMNLSPLLNALPIRSTILPVSLKKHIIASKGALPSS